MRAASVRPLAARSASRSWLGAVGLYVLARETPMFALDTDRGRRRAAARRRARARGARDRSRARACSSLDVVGDRPATRARFPTLRPVAYDRDFPHTLRVTVAPEHPVAVARRGAKAWLVAASARVIAPLPVARPSGSAADLARAFRRPGSRRADHRSFRPARVSALALARLAQLPRPHPDGARARATTSRSLLGSGSSSAWASSSDPARSSRSPRASCRASSRTAAIAYVDVSVPGAPGRGVQPSTLSLSVRVSRRDRR